MPVLREAPKEERLMTCPFGRGGGAVAHHLTLRTAGLFTGESRQAYTVRRQRPGDGKVRRLSTCCQGRLPRHVGGLVGAQGPVEVMNKTPGVDEVSEHPKGLREPADSAAPTFEDGGRQGAT